MIIAFVRLDWTKEAEKAEQRCTSEEQHELNLLMESNNHSLQ